MTSAPPPGAPRGAPARSGPDSGDSRTRPGAEAYRARFRQASHELEAALDRDREPPAGAPGEPEDSSPVVLASRQVVETLIAIAAETRASDIHLALHEDRAPVRLRVAGTFLELGALGGRAARRIVSSLVHAAGLDPCHRRSPQDGRLTYLLGTASHSLRIAVIPTVDGLKLTLRFVGAAARNLGLESLGFPDAFVTILDGLLLQPGGVILFTGPCSSGKSTTMYAAMQRIRQRAGDGRSLISLEDPVELHTGHYPQVAIHPRAGLTYARALRSVLRHDPDVIMVGEIRGASTARLVLQAGLTGHLVLSTLHAGRAPLVFSRLGRMGIDGFLMGTTIRAAIGLRLVRTLCPRPGHLPPLRLVSTATGVPAGEPELLEVPGCPECLGTGYGSRQPIAEVLRVDPDLARALQDGIDIPGLEILARRTGYEPLEDQLARMVASGRTTTAESRRILG